MDPLILALIFGGGFVAGIINAVAGGGSIITLPILVFAGLPVSTANGTNRVAIVFQNIGAVAAYRRGGVTLPRETWALLVPSILGAVLGVRLAVHLDERTLSQAIAVVLVLMLIPILRKPATRKREPGTLRLKLWVWPAYFLVGVYGGFIQAGVGFLYLALLVGVQGMSLVRANLVKVFLVLVYTVIALVLFAAEGQVALVEGVALAAGNAWGGWLGARTAVEKGERWIRAVLVAAVLLCAAKLLGWLPG